MSNLTAEQAHLFVHNILLGILKNESRTTKSVLAAVPDVNLDYRPDPSAKSANELLRHIASADNWFIKSVVDGVFAPGSVKIPEDVKRPEEVLQWYENEYAKNFDAVTKMSGELLAILSGTASPILEDRREKAWRVGTAAGREPPQCHGIERAVWGGKWFSRLAAKRQV